jgi:hypothetical protein
MFKRLFVDHPKSVDENYVEHFGVASRFGFTMIWGGMRLFRACASHRAAIR